jgi:hypothetical protein
MCPVLRGYRGQTLESSDQHLIKDPQRGLTGEAALVRLRGSGIRLVSSGDLGTLTVLSASTSAPQSKVGPIRVNSWMRQNVYSGHA